MLRYILTRFIIISLKSFLSLRIFIATIIKIGFDKITASSLYTLGSTSILGFSIEFISIVNDVPIISLSIKNIKYNNVYIILLGILTS